ncbi:MAG TPA: hypothetical protein EYP55_05345, partial [Anaerolineae bacterium]|nr:hypothetical protein [Anaerolineae bacterium]
MSEVQRPRSKGWDGGFGAWVLDQRGSTLTQFVLVLPILLVLLYGSFAVWKVASAKQSLASGTYQAARYLSVEGRYLDYPGEWEYAARVIIVRELGNNSLLRPLPEPAISFEPPFRPQCPPEDAINNPWPHLDRALFTIRAEITLPWPARIPFLDPETITLVEKRTSYIECGPLLEPTPTPTEEPVPTPTL